VALLILLGGVQRLNSTGSQAKVIGQPGQQEPLYPRSSRATGSLKAMPLGQGLQDQDSSCSVLESGKTPINVGVLCDYLQIYPNEQDVDLLIDGFRNGFRLGFVGVKLVQTQRT